MAFNQNDRGLKRANPDAQQANNLRLTDPSTPGTPAIDTITVDSSAMTGVELASGLLYQPVGGTAKVIKFGDQNIPAGGIVEKELVLDFIDAVGATTAVSDLQRAIIEAVGREENGPEIKVTYTGNPTDEIVITHTGSGTLSKLVVDGAQVGTHGRAAIP